MTSPRWRYAADLTLVLATALWGMAFLVTRHAIADVPVLPFVALRFATACIAVSLASGAAARAVTRVEWRAGKLLGLAMFGGYALQAEGLHSLAAGKTAFISALYVPLVPVIQIFLTRQWPSLRQWGGIALACAGLMVMTGASLAGLGAGLGRGESFALAGAFAIAAEITLVGRFARLVDPRRLAIVECAVVALLAVALSFTLGLRWPAPAPLWIGCALGLGCASAFLQISTNWAMRQVPPTRAILIFAAEPVWAALFGRLAGEHMSTPALFGGALILAALVLGALPAEDEQHALV